ncbi:MAG: hypothetical protein ACQEQV_03715 [Fibrobacterota bacterium]
MFRLCLCVLWLSVCSLQAGNDWLVLDDGTRMEGDIREKNPFFGHPRLILDGSDTLVVDSVVRYWNDQDLRVKIPDRDIDFATRIDSGNIQIYLKRDISTTTMPGQNNGFTAGGHGYGTGASVGVTTTKEEEVYFYSEPDNFDLIRADYDHLMVDLADSEASMEHLDTYKRRQRGGLITFLSGLALMGGGGAVINSSQEAGVALFSTGTVVGIVGLVVNKSKEDELKDALLDYNLD